MKWGCFLSKLFLSLLCENISIYFGETVKSFQDYFDFSRVLAGDISRSFPSCLTVYINSILFEIKKTMIFTREAIPKMSATWLGKNIFSEYSIYVSFSLDIFGVNHILLGKLLWYFPLPLNLIKILGKRMNL